MTTLDARPTRRILFHGLGAVGVACVLAGCGGSGGTGGASTTTPTAGDVLAATSEVPVGGGIVLSDAGLVITQPTEGEFVAFTAVCTHQQAPLARVADDGIECDLHGSRFAITDGAATQGPATEPLETVEIEIDGDQILAV